MKSRRLKFSRAQRLTKPAEFHRLKSEGTSFRGSTITLAVLATGQGPARAGFITSRRVGSAVLRNRVRRRLREIFRRHQHQIAAGTWIVTIASARATDVDYGRLEDDWLRLARRASILAP